MFTFVLRTDREELVLVLRWRGEEWKQHGRLTITWPVEVACREIGNNSVFNFDL